MTYISLSGLLIGIDPDLSFYLLSIANASSLVGRIAGGVFADKYGMHTTTVSEAHIYDSSSTSLTVSPLQTGALNVLIPGTLAAGIMTYAWPFAKTEGPLVAVAVLYGMTSGVFVAIMAQPVVRMGTVTEVGMRTGMAFTVMSLGALAGPPISGAILDHSGKLENVGYYAGMHDLCQPRVAMCMCCLRMGRRGTVS